MRLDLGNQYQVRAATTAHPLQRRFATAPDALPPELALWRLPSHQSFVTYEDSGAAPRLMGEEGDLGLEKAVGQGHVLFLGLAPRMFAQSPEDAQRLRDLVRYVMERRPLQAPPYEGGVFRAPGYLKLKRGRYVVAKTFDQPLRMEGSFIDLLKSTLPLVSQVELGPDQLTLLYDAAPDQRDGPQLLYSSSCVEWKQETARETKFYLSGALGTVGVCRLWRGNRPAPQIMATDAKGQAAEIEMIEEGPTLLLRYDNQPQGLGIRLLWEGNMD